MTELDALTAEEATEEIDLDDSVEEIRPGDWEIPAELDALGAYLKGIGRYPLITAEREVELAKRMEAGQLAEQRIASGKKPRRADAGDAADGDRARTEMIQANLRLVVAVARKYNWTGVPLLDLIQEGNIGLMRGVSKFEWRRGFKFSTYATWWIRQAIQRGVADRGRVIRLPVHIHELVLQVGRARSTLKAELGREPSDREIANYASVPVARVAEIQLLAPHVLSLETPVGSEGNSTLGEFVPDDSSDERFEEVLSGIGREEAVKVIATLNDRERRIIALRFGLSGDEPLTLEQVGNLFGLTRERIRQLESKALSKLRHPSRSAALRVEGEEPG